MTTEDEKLSIRGTYGAVFISLAIDGVTKVLCMSPGSTLPFCYVDVIHPFRVGALHAVEQQEFSRFFVRRPLPCIANCGVACKALVLSVSDKQLPLILFAGTRKKELAARQWERATFHALVIDDL